MRTAKCPLILLLTAAVCLLACCSTAARSGAPPVPVAETPAAPARQTAPTVIILRHDGDEGSVTHMGALRFKGHLEQLSQGALTVDIYPGNKLGSRLDTEYALRYGTVTMHMGEPLYAALHCLAWVPLAGSMERYRGVIRTGRVRALIDAECDEQGTLFLGTVSDEYQILSSARPVDAIEDLAGMRIAVPEGRSGAFWEALGATVVESPRRQFFTAVQQGVVDAQDDVLQYSLVGQTSRYHPYIHLTGHRISSRAVYIHKKFYTDLPPEQREMVDASVAEVQQYLGEYLQSSQDEILRLLREGGKTVSAPDPALQAALWEQSRPALLQDLAETCGQQAVDDLLQALAA